MNETRWAKIEQIREFLVSTSDVHFSTPLDRQHVRLFRTRLLTGFKYDWQCKAERGVLFAYMRRLSGFSHSLLASTRIMIAQRFTSSEVAEDQMFRSINLVSSRRA